MGKTGYNQVIPGYRDKNRKVVRVKRERSKPANQKAKEMARLGLLRDTANLWAKGYDYDEISRRTGVTVTAVSLRIKEVLELWKTSASRDYGERLAIELAKLDRVEAEAWDAWERSKEDAVSTKRMVQKALRKAADGDDGDKELVTIGKMLERVSKGRVGDPTYLKIVQSCVLDRCKLLGVVKELHVNNTSNTTNVLSVTSDGRPIPGAGFWDELMRGTGAVPSDDPLAERLLALPPVVEGTETADDEDGDHYRRGSDEI